MTPPEAPEPLGRAVDGTDGHEEEPDDQRGPRFPQATKPASRDVRQGALEGEEEGPAEHGPEQGTKERLEDVVNGNGCAAGQDNEQGGGRVVEGLLQGLVVALGEDLEDVLERGPEELSARGGHRRRFDRRNGRLDERKMTKLILFEEILTVHGPQP